VILLLPGQTKHVYLKCGCRKTEVDADDFGTWARKCRVCKRWTRYTVRSSPSGRRVEVKVEWATAEEVAA